MKSPLAGVMALTVALSFSASAAFLSAQQTPDPPKQTPESSAVAPPVFKIQTDLVLVPAVIRGHKGEHVTGLSKDVFHLEENGIEQKISLFEEIHATNDAPPPPLELNGGFSNLPFDTTQQLRLTIIVLDFLNTTQLQRTDGKEQITKLLSGGLARNQPVALLCLTHKGVLPVGPTTADVGVLIRALKNTPIGPETVMSRRSAEDTTLRQFRDIARSYVGIPGRKVMVLAAGNIPELRTEESLIEASVLAEDIRQMWKSILDANIAVYPFQIMDWQRTGAFGSQSARRLDITLRQFAEATGGNFCVEGHDLFGCLADAEEDLRSYYMLGFSVQPNDRKPGWRDLRVKVSVDHTSVHARDGFYYGAPPPDDATAVREAENTALASPLPYSAVPIYVKVLPPDANAAAATAPDKKKIEFLMIIPVSGIKIDPTKPNSLDLDVGAIALTRDTREAAEFSHPVRGNPKPEALKQLDQEGIRLHEKLDLPPGYYDIRFLVRDNNTGQIGTLVFPLEVKQ